MEHIEKIAIGLLLFVLTSVVAYLCRLRQLYVAVPKLFRHAPISKNGSLCELIVFNKGNQVEEQIQVELDPELKAELLASGSADISLEGSMLKVERLHKGSEASVMLMIENGLLDASKVVRVTSKATKGRVCRRVSDVPFNYAWSLVGIIILGCIGPGFPYAMRAYNAVYSGYVESQLSSAYKLGWSDLATYYDSKLKGSYSELEFPVRYLGKGRDDKKREILRFEAYNKTAVPIVVYAGRRGDKRIGSPYFSSADVPPLSKLEFQVLAPPPDPVTSDVALDFSFKMGNEFLHSIAFKLPSD